MGRLVKRTARKEQEFMTLFSLIDLGHPSALRGEVVYISLIFIYLFLFTFRFPQIFTTFIFGPSNFHPLRASTLYNFVQ